MLPNTTRVVGWSPRAISLHCREYTRNEVTSQVQFSTLTVSHQSQCNAMHSPRLATTVRLPGAIGAA
jgi:hypothetical protein